jgi:hypothetical protein
MSQPFSVPISYINVNNVDISNIFQPNNTGSTVTNIYSGGVNIGAMFTPFYISNADPLGSASLNVIR